MPNQTNSCTFASSKRVRRKRGGRNQTAESKEEHSGDSARLHKLSHFPLPRDGMAETSPGLRASSAITIRLYPVLAPKPALNLLALISSAPEQRAAPGRLTPNGLV